MYVEKSSLVNSASPLNTHMYVHMYGCVCLCHNVQNSTYQKAAHKQSFSWGKGAEVEAEAEAEKISQAWKSQRRCGVRVSLPPKTKSKLSTQFSIKLTKCTRTYSYHSTTHTHIPSHPTPTHSHTKLRSNVLIHPSLSRRKEKKVKIK